MRVGNHWPLNIATPLYEIDVEDGIVRVAFTERPSVDEMMASFRPVNALADNRLRLWVLHDGLDWTPAELQTIAEFTRMQQPQPEKVAVVSPHDLGYGLMRIFQAYQESDTGAEVRVFRDEESARAFLLSAADGGADA